MRQISVLLCFLAFAFTGHVKIIYATCDEDFEALNKKRHYSHPWKVHEIAKDFELLDVWEFPILADKTRNQDFSIFLKVMQQNSKPSVHSYFSIRSLIARFLVILRVFLGETLGLDQNINTLPIPGCKETSLKERLSVEDRNRNLAEASQEEAPYEGFWRTVYRYENEMLTELSNNTVHALMHFIWIQKSGNYYTAQLAVYAKPRGAMGEFYMKLVMPFRRMIIYPVLMKDLKNKWGLLTTDLKHK